MKETQEGLLITNISAFSLSLGIDDLNMNFSNDKPDFSMTIKRTFDSIKRYYLKNTNELAVEQKPTLEGMLQIAAEFFSTIRIPYLDTMMFIINPTPKNDTWMPGGLNPNINSNYISTMVDISILDTTSNASIASFNSTYLPMKESGSNTGDDNQLQFIASQSLLNALVTSFFNSKLFLT